MNQKKKRKSKRRPGKVHILKAQVLPLNYSRKLPFLPTNRQREQINSKILSNDETCAEGDSIRRRLEFQTHKSHPWIARLPNEWLFLPNYFGVHEEIMEWFKVLPRIENSLRLQDSAL